MDLKALPWDLIKKLTIFVFKYAVEHPEDAAAVERFVAALVEELRS